MELNPITKAIRTQIERTNEKEHSSPLFLTSSFMYDDVEQMRAAFADEIDVNIYSRFSNPNVQELVDRMCAPSNAHILSAVSATRMYRNWLTGCVHWKALKVAMLLHLA